MFGLQVRDLQSKLYNSDTNLSTFLAKDQMKFLQASPASRNKGITWSVETIRQAFQIRYICGAQGYEFIRHLHYPLPSYRTLCDRIQQTPFRPGIQADIVNWLRCKLQSSAVQERDCVLMLDEMAVRKCLEYDKGLRSLVGGVSPDVCKSSRECGAVPDVVLASHALVVMIRGLTTNWKQVVAYYLTGDSVEGNTLWHVVKSVIVELYTASVNVRAVVCDMGSCNRAMWRAAGIVACKDQIVNRIHHPVVTQSLYFLPDVPHVLKNVRNCLLSNDIVLPPETVQQYSLPGAIVSMSHVQKLHELQQASDLKIAPSLRRQHVAPKQFEKMKVRFAAQLFSHSVSSALQFCVNANLLPVAALTTAWFLQFVNEWFDVANARTKLQALHLQSAKKICVLKSMQSLGPRLHFRSRQTPSCEPKMSWKPIQTGLLMATKSLLDMHAEFVETRYYRYLMTSRLTQDALENLFSQIRGRGDSHPSPVKFRHNLRLITISQFTKTPRKTSYECDDSAQFVAPLLRAKARQDDSHHADELVETNEDLNDMCCDVSGMFDTCEENALTYLAGWIAFKLKSKVSCAECSEWLTRNKSHSDDDDDDAHSVESAALQLTLIKSFGGSDYGLTLPSDELQQLVRGAESVFRVCKGECVQNTDIPQTLLGRSSALLAHASDIPQCHGVAHKVLQKFFRLRLHIFAKQLSNAAGDECQHGSKSAKARTAIK